MPALPDLIDQPALLSYLGDLAFTAPELAKLPGLAASASASIRKHCNRAFSLWTFDQLYTVESPATLLVLKQFPVPQVLRCCTNPTSVLNIANLDTTTNQRATVSLATTGDTYTGLVVTGVTLWRIASGVPVSTPLLFSTYVTVQSLAAAINALGVGWKATVNTPYSLWPTADLRAVQGVKPALGTTSADLFIHVDDLDFQLREDSGILQLGSTSSYDIDSLRFGPMVTSDVEDLQTYGGFNGLRVVYPAGWATVPADVQTFTAECVKAAVERFRTDASLKSESDGVYSWSARDELLPIPYGIACALSPYINRRG